MTNAAKSTPFRKNLPSNSDQECDTDNMASTEAQRACSIDEHGGHRKDTDSGRTSSAALHETAGDIEKYIAYVGAQFDEKK